MGKETGMHRTPRRAAFDILLRMERADGFSDRLLDSLLEKRPMPRRDADLVTALVYGVLEHRIRLDYIIDRLARRSGGRMRPEVRTVLRLGVCQLALMDKIPPSAAVNESVALVRAAGCGWAAGFVNALLRRVARRAGDLPLPDRAADEVAYLSVRYSCPVWLVRKWRADYGRETAEAILAAMERRAPVAARANTLRVTVPELIRVLGEQGVEAAAAALPGALELSGASGLHRLPAHREGLFFLQDYASQRCCLAVAPRPGETVLDMCAAPGGKSFGMALMMEGRGRVLALELHPARVGLIEAGARRLGLANVRARCHDSSVPDDSLGPADRVLCDVPCSGLGVIRRKPEIRYRPQEVFDSLPGLQYSILYEGSRHLRPGGILVYSTCTLSRAENEEVVRRFLSENPGFAGDALPPECAGGPPGGFCATLFPGRDGTDGFFIARMKRNR